MFFKKLLNKILRVFNYQIIKNPSLLALSKQATFQQFLDKSLLETTGAIQQFLDKSLLETKETIVRHQIATTWQCIDQINTMKKPSVQLSCAFCNALLERSKLKVYETQCVFNGGRLTRYQCSECDIIFGDEKMLGLTEAQLTQEYKNHYAVYSEGDSTELEIQAFFALSPIKSGVYLNYGAGAWSNSVEVLRKEGWNVYAFEPHASAEKTVNPDFVIQSLEQLSSMKFDGIYSNDVLEHLRIPNENLLFLTSLLTSNGFMAHATSCFEYLYEYTRFHLFFFLGRSRELLAKKSNLKIEEYIAEKNFKCLVLSKRNA